MEQELRERKLRQQIHAIRVKKFHWPLDGFKFIMNGLGFGESLTALHEDKLLELKSLMTKYRKHGRPVEFNYDRQGKFMHALMKSTGWTEKDLRAFMIIHYQKTHWNLLDSRERRAIIAMLQKYANKQTDKQSNQDTAINPKGIQMSRKSTKAPKERTLTDAQGREISVKVLHQDILNGKQPSTKRWIVLSNCKNVSSQTNRRLSASSRTI